MKCFVIVDAQKDFLPMGSFNSRKDYIDALNKINSIRLKLHNCNEADLIKLKDCKHMMQYQQDKLLKENIVEYYQCSNDIDDQRMEEDILLFPPDSEMAINDLYACNGLHNKSANTVVNGMKGIYNAHHSSNCHTREEVRQKNVKNDSLCDVQNSFHHDMHMSNNHLKEHGPIVAEIEAVIKGVKEKPSRVRTNFVMNILSVDYHPQYHVSFAETHRTVYEQISKNCGVNKNNTKMNGNGTDMASFTEPIALLEGEEHLPKDKTYEEKEKTKHNEEVCENNNEDDDIQSTFLKKHKISNLTDVIKNIRNITSTKYIYKNVNSLNDIMEYSKLNFLNEVIDVWPVHCVRDTPGCKIHEKLFRHINDIVIKKADTENHDSHTIFENNTINHKILKLLKERNVKSVYICGFIFEYCVKETALSFLNHGFETYIVEDATAYLHGRQEDKENIRKKGIHFVNSLTMFL
ncbi:nicotinamidase [Plasmodium gonderi]|uniref:nicotinamidase n=1 Tax=Plasmodium gonderi TaxID=77519 RepID=A0A1Y1JDN2_PLAGO|nr:nicotinamidase [Plasmodium gonderi]GAW80619.1 nicotinamidase [Plasmodium gonderi]